MAYNRQIRRSSKIANLMGHQQHTQAMPECVCVASCLSWCAHSTRLFFLTFWLHFFTDFLTQLREDLNMQYPK